VVNKKEIVLTANDVSQIFGMSMTSVYDLLRTGELEGFYKKRRWIIPNQSIDRFLFRNAYGKGMDERKKV